MSPPVSTLLSGLWLCLVLSRAARPMWKACDNGKLLLGRDLPPSVVWSCPVISWPESTTQKIASIDTKYPPQRIEHVCMDTPITYNHTIPNSGAHRTVGAESGEYLYCPPQRWLNNLQPLALVSWGRTLELSHVTTSEVCDWLQSTAAHGNRGDVDQSRQYNLLLTHPADHKHAYPKQKSLRQCCEETLSLLDGWLEVTDWGRGRVRKSRAALRKEGKEKERRTTLDRTEPNRVQKHGTTLQPEAEGQATVRATQGGTDRELKVTQPHRRENDTNEKDPRGKVRETDWVNQNEAEDKRQSGKTGDIQEREEKSSRHEGETQPVDSPTKRKKPLSQSQPKQLAVTQANSQDRRADCDGRVGHCECTETIAPLGAAVAGPGDRMLPTPRTDEAVWAAAALGFLLVLLVLSVLHTRLYRHWRTTPSMYWHDSKQDYDRVADVIHRRLKMPGRRKRRASKCRRQECVLLPPSSSTEEDE
uniref:Tumor protein p53-inducible protein 13 n=1 Tax=Oncorhynchus tshawytscha TaxID=74940 RepID=A0AAZ3QQY0_ONCTS